jgi:histone H4
MNDTHALQHRRMRGVLRNKILGISKGDIRRLARRGGVVRMCRHELFFKFVRDALMDFAKRVMVSAIRYTEHASRKTVSRMDVLYGLKREGIVLYGFGEPLSH